MENEQQYYIKVLVVFIKVGVLKVRWKCATDKVQLFIE